MLREMKIKFTSSEQRVPTLSQQLSSQPMQYITILIKMSLIAAARSMPLITIVLCAAHATCNLLK